VQISRTPEGDLIIHPCPPKRGEALLEVLAAFDSQFVESLEQLQRESQPMQTREQL
jgi:antitoxin VapB